MSLFVHFAASEHSFIHFWDCNHPHPNPAATTWCFRKLYLLLIEQTLKTTIKTLLLGQVFMNGIFPSSTFPFFCEWKTTGNVLGKALGILKPWFAKRTKVPPSVVKPWIWLAGMRREVSFIRKDKEKKFERLKEKIHQSKSFRQSEHPIARKAS